MIRPLLLSLLVCACASPALADEAPFVLALPSAANVTGDAVVRPESASEFALATPAVELADGPELALLGRHHAPKPARPAKRAPEGMPLGPERARILLRSLTVPGWGQVTVGRRHAGAFFGVTELGIWTAFTAFRVQDLLRSQSSVRTAKLFAGIDLKGRDDEYRRIVGAFGSSDEYNLYVVTRDAANLYMADPYNADLAAYHAYITEHSLTGANAWAWTDRASFDRYRAQRKDAQRASLRANTMLGVAIANRIVSAVHAMRAAGHVKPSAPSGTSWQFEMTPVDGADPEAFRAGLRASF